MTRRLTWSESWKALQPGYVCEIVRFFPLLSTISSSQSLLKPAVHLFSCSPSLSPAATTRSLHMMRQSSASREALFESEADLERVLEGPAAGVRV